MSNVIELNIGDFVKVNDKPGLFHIISMDDTHFELEKWPDRDARNNVTINKTQCYVDAEILETNRRVRRILVTTRMAEQASHAIAALRTK